MKRRRKKKVNYDKLVNKRLIVLIVFTIFSFCILLGKLFLVMIIEKPKYEKKLSSLTYSTITGTSSHRGRIYDRNYNLLVDNKSLKTITYQKPKGVTDLEMIKIASLLSSHIEIDYSKLSDRNKREYYYAKEKEYCDSLVTKKEKEKVKQHKLSQKELNELKLQRIPDEKLELSEEEQKIAYLYYLMNKGYTYEEKIIKSDATEEEYAYVSEHLEELDGLSGNINVLSKKKVYNILSLAGNKK